VKLGLSMKIKPHLIATALLLCFQGSFASQVVISGDGKKYRLHTDGTWELVSEDRIIDTPDGKRVVLKADGTWRYAGLAPKQDKTEFQSAEISASIDKIHISETRESVGAGKNTRTSYRTELTLDLSLDSTSTGMVSLGDLDKTNFSLTDNRGKRYPVASVVATSKALQPGQSTKLSVISNKAPKSLQKVAEFILEIEIGAVGNDVKVTLAHDYDKVERTVLNR